VVSRRERIWLIIIIALAIAAIYTTLPSTDRVLDRNRGYKSYLRLK
jgi:hypothetical protein